MHRLVVGVDVTSIDRIAGAMRRHPRFAEKIFTEAERRRAGSKPERFASRWAAKEAVMKWYGGPACASPLSRHRGGEPAGGRPEVRVHGQPTGLAISMTTTPGGDRRGGGAAGGSRRSAGASPPEGLRLPARPATAHKGIFGTVVVIAGAMARRAPPCWPDGGPLGPVPAWCASASRPGSTPRSPASAWS